MNYYTYIYNYLVKALDQCSYYYIDTPDMHVWLYVASRQ